MKELNILFNNYEHEFWTKTSGDLKERRDPIESPKISHHTKNATQIAAESNSGGKKPVGKVTRTLRPIMDQSQSKYQLIDCDVVDESRTRREGFGNDDTKD